MKTETAVVVEGQPPQEIQVRDKGIEYCLRCEAHDIYVTKFRMPKDRKPPDVIVDPSYDKIMKAIRG